MEEIRGMKDKSYLFEAAVTELTMNVLDSGEGFLAGEGNIRCREGLRCWQKALHRRWILNR